MNASSTQHPHTSKTCRLAAVCPSQWPAVPPACEDPLRGSASAVPDTGDPTPVPQLRDTVASAGRLFWAGEFARLVAMLPSLIGEGLDAATAVPAGPVRVGAPPR